MKRLTLVLGFAITLALSTPNLYAIGGVPLWTNIYTEPNNGFDVPAAIAVDGNGNVIVTGSSPGGSGTTMDYATVAYSNAGSPLWTNRLDWLGGSSEAAAAVVADAAGHVIVTGSALGSAGAVWDFVTVMYSNAGIPLWTNGYNGAAHQDDKAYAVACDANGNVFVTGSSWNGSSKSYVTIKYSGSGQSLWTNRYGSVAVASSEGFAIVVSVAGDVIVTGYTTGDSYHDYATVAYSNSGLPLWTNVYGSAGIADDRAVAIACDASGKVFVTGYSEGETSGFDYATIAYSNTGQPLWTNRYNGPASAEDRPHGIAVDSNGNVYVTGSSAGIGSDDDYATVAYSNSGVPVWTNRYNGPGNYYDIANAIAVDKAGNVFVTGESWAATSEDFATVGYTSAGVPLWTNRFNGAGNGNDYAYAIAVDSSGNVFITGEARQGVATANDYVTIKYSSSIPSPAYLNYQKLNGKLLLTWTNAGFSLQSAPTCTGTFTNIPSATSPYTNSITGAQRFFRLISN